MSVSPPFPDRRRTVPGGRPAREVVEAIFPDARIAYVQRWGAIAHLLDSFEDQRPATCGAYVTRYLLSPLGFMKSDEIDTTREDYLAYLAGTVIEDAEMAEVTAAREAAKAAGLTDIEACRRYPRTWYGWPVRSADAEPTLGTSPTGTARAISIASGGALVTLPIASRDEARNVLLTPERFDALLELIEIHLADWGVHPIANLEVDQLLDSTSEAYTAEALVSADPSDAIPRERWGVGHFVGIGAFWRGEDGRRWVLMLDSYKARGFDGYVPMPAESLRRAVVREDGRDGGLLLVMRRGALDVARASIEGLGLEIRMWGNGSLEPEGRTWELGR